jgi:hypothetical protein
MKFPTPFSRKVLIGGTGLLLLLVTAFFAVKVNAQNQSVTVLTDRLKGRGVAVKNISIISRIPFGIDITLSSSSTSDVATFNDIWSALLVEHETRLAYRIGISVDTYTVRMVNAEGKEISYYKSTLDNNNSKGPKAISSNLNDGIAKQRVMNSLQLGEIKLNSVEVITDNTFGTEGQILTITGSVPDLAAANRSVVPFVESFKGMLSNATSDSSMYINMCKVRLIDNEGNMILEYAIDADTGAEIFGGAPGLTNSFYPHPPNVDIPADQPSHTGMNATPNGSFSYPAPTSTWHPYP